MYNIPDILFEYLTNSIVKLNFALDRYSCKRQPLACKHESSNTIPNLIVRQRWPNDFRILHDRWYVLYMAMHE